jgi:hypothetical protein
VIAEVEVMVDVYETDPGRLAAFAGGPPDTGKGGKCGSDKVGQYGHSAIVPA